MRKEGYLLYDSDQYLDDIKLFTKGLSTNWRQKNNNVCDSPNLYFALLHNGEISPCCDHRIDRSIPAYDDNFPQIYKSKTLKNLIFEKTSKCEGCMYGSYPEMTIAMRYLQAKLQRIKTFITPPEKNGP